MLRLILLTITVLLSYCSTSQTFEDSCTCIPNKQLRKAAVLIEKGKYTAEMLDICSKNDSINRLLLDERQARIEVYKKKDSICQAIIILCDRANKNLQDQRDIAITGMKKINKSLRWQKRKTVFVAVSEAVIFIGGYLLLKN